MSPLFCMGIINAIISMQFVQQLCAIWLNFNEVILFSRIYMLQLSVIDAKIKI